MSGLVYSSFRVWQALFFTIRRICSSAFIFRQRKGDVAPRPGPSPNFLTYVSILSPPMHFFSLYGPQTTSVGPPKTSVQHFACFGLLTVASSLIILVSGRQASIPMPSTHHSYVAHEHYYFMPISVQSHELCLRMHPHTLHTE